jgi:conserved hypothetical protein YidD
MVKKTLILLVTSYRKFISPLLGNCCRFYPSCSWYAQEAIERFGVIGGGWLTIKRLLKCHPLGTKEWYDPVPNLDGGDVMLKKKLYDR